MRAPRTSSSSSTAPRPSAATSSSSTASSNYGSNIAGRPSRAIFVDAKTLTDAPILAPLARELAEHERLGRFAADLSGARARVSEAALPLVASALHLALDRRLVCALPDDADARDAAEAAAWYL